MKKNMVQFVLIMIGLSLGIGAQAETIGELISQKTGDPIIECENNSCNASGTFNTSGWSSQFGPSFMELSINMWISALDTQISCADIETNIADIKYFNIPIMASGEVSGFGVSFFASPPINFAGNKANLYLSELDQWWCPMNGGLDDECKPRRSPRGSQSLSYRDDWIVTYKGDDPEAPKLRCMTLANPKAKDLQDREAVSCTINIMGEDATFKLGYNYTYSLVLKRTFTVPSGLLKKFNNKTMETSMIVTIDRSGCCGNKVIDEIFDETCDPLDPTDKNRANCYFNICHYCGDDIQDEAKEECDDGDRNSNDKPGAKCNLQCKRIKCGNGVIEAGNNELCDDGEKNADTPNHPCGNACIPPTCGDIAVDDKTPITYFFTNPLRIEKHPELGFEQCDEGEAGLNGQVKNGCSSCRLVGNKGDPGPSGEPGPTGEPFPTDDPNPTNTPGPTDNPNPTSAVSPTPASSNLPVCDVDMAESQCKYPIGVWYSNANEDEFACAVANDSDDSIYGDSGHSPICYCDPATSTEDCEADVPTAVGNDACPCVKKGFIPKYPVWLLRQTGDLSQANTPTKSFWARLTNLFGAMSASVSGWMR